MKDLSNPQGTRPWTNVRNAVEDDTERARAVRSAVEHSRILAREAEAVILRDGHVIDVHDLIEPASPADVDTNRAADEMETESDLYGHPQHRPPEAE